MIYFILVLFGLLAISILLNVIFIICLRKRRISAINEHNKAILEKKKFMKKLNKKKGEINEKIEKSKNIDDYLNIYDDIMSDNDN